MVRLLDMTPPFVHFFTGAFVPIYVEYGHHFHIEDGDGCATRDHGVEVEFDKSSCASHVIKT